MSDLKILDDFKLIYEFPVAWIDMDSLGHVNSSKYFTYLETARIKYYENLELLDYFKENNISAVVARTECSYLIPVTYPDIIEVGARVTELDNYIFNMEYYVKTRKLGLVAIGEADIVIFNFNTNSKIVIPDFVAAKIQSFEKLYK